MWSSPIKWHRSTIPHHPRLIKSKAWLWYLSSSCSPRYAISMCMISNFFVYTILHIKFHLLDRPQQVPSWEDGGWGEVGLGHENSEMKKCLDTCPPPLSILKVLYHGFKAITPKQIISLITRLGCYFFPEDSIFLFCLIKMLREKHTSILLAVITYLLTSHLN